MHLTDSGLFSEFAQITDCCIRQKRVLNDLECFGGWLLAYCIVQGENVLECGDVSALPEVCVRRQALTNFWDCHCK